MSLDVVVVTYESAAHIGTCLGALPDSARVVVVDNASVDDSADLAAGHGALVVRNATNTGFAAAANTGAAEGDGELVLFLNPDAHIDGLNLERLVTALQADPSAAIAGPRIVHPDGANQRPWWPFPSARRSWSEALGLHFLSRDRHPVHVPFVVGACFLIRRSVFEALGGFDEAYWLYGEEADLCRRASTAGWRVRYVPEAQVVHVGGASVEAAGSARVAEHFLLGTDRFVASHGGRAALVSHRLALLTGSLLRAGSLAARPSHPTAVHRRALVRRQLHVLASGPWSVPSPPVGTDRHRDDLVVCSLEDWDDTWRRNQFLVRELLALSPSRRVLFIEPAVDVVHELRRTRRWPQATGLRSVSDDGRLWAFQPRKVWPRVLGPWADHSLVRQAESAARTLGISSPTLWINDALYAPLLARTGWPALYDVTDDWIEAASSDRRRRRLRRREAAILTMAGVVTVCSPALARTKGRKRSVRLIANAVDVEHFTRPRVRPLDLPGGPCAVYLGTLHEDRLDVDLVVDLAWSLPAVQVVLVGPDSLTAGSHKALRAQPNVHLLGPRPYEDVPGYLQHADVVIVPHVVTPFTESLDPIKAYEILAVGTPAVATPVAGLRSLGPPVRCSPRKGFVATVESVLEGSSGRVDAEVPSWAERAVVFEKALQDVRRPDGRLSVVYVDHCAQLSGGEIALSRLLPALDAVDSYVVLAEDGPLRPRLEALGVTCEVLAMSEGGRGLKRVDVTPARLPLRAAVESTVYTVRLARRLRQLRPDLVHTNSLKAGIYGSLAARIAGVPVVWHVRDRIAPDYLPRPAVALVHALIRYLPSAVVANSEATLESLGGVPRTSVIASPVIYDAVEPRRSAGGRPHGGGFVVGMVGRIAAWKGQDVFLRAFASAFAEGSERAVIVGSPLFGEDAYLSELRQLVHDLDIADRIEFTGFQEGVSALLGGFDLLVHASVIPEPFGQVIVEAMAAGVPVIASGQGGPREIIGPPEAERGILVAPGDVSGLSSAMRRVQADESLRRRLSENGRLRAKDFMPSASAAKMMTVYRAVVPLWKAHRGRRSFWR